MKNINLKVHFASLDIYLPLSIFSSPSIVTFPTASYKSIQIVNVIPVYRALSMKILSLFVSLALFTNSFAGGLKPDELMKSYSKMTSSSISAFKEMVEANWSQKYNKQGVRITYRTNENGDLIPIHKKYPFGFEKKLSFGLSSKLEGGFFGLFKKRKYYFAMIGGTWKGANTSWPSGGAGYAYPIKIKQMGFKENGNSLSFFFWGRNENYVEKSNLTPIYSGRM